MASAILRQSVVAHAAEGSRWCTMTMHGTTSLCKAAKRRRSTYALSCKEPCRLNKARVGRSCSDSPGEAHGASRRSRVEWSTKGPKGSFFSSIYCKTTARFHVVYNPENSSCTSTSAPTTDQDSKNCFPMGTRTSNERFPVGLCSGKR